MSCWTRLKLEKVSENKTAYDIDLWGTNSEKYLTKNKSYYISNKGIISSDLEDKNKPYTTIISFEGGKHGKQ